MNDSGDVLLNFVKDLVELARCMGWMERNRARFSRRQARLKANIMDDKYSQVLILLTLVGTTVSAATVHYSTYFGAAGYDGAYAVAVDSAGNAYVAGSTGSTNGFPALNAFQPSYGGGFADAFLVKFDPDGRLIFSTLFGGTGYDAVNALAIDREGNLVLAGETHSVDLPTTDDAFQPEYQGGSAFGSGDGFIAKLTPDGAQLLYCSYFGGSGDERINDLVVDANGNLCFTGQTDSKDLPLNNPLQTKFGGGNSDGFIVKFDASLTNLVFSSYWGGENRDEGQKIAVDPAGFIYVSGNTLSTNFPLTAGAFQNRHVVEAEIGENWDAFVTKLKPDGSALVYSTYIGDALDDGAFAIAADGQGSAYVTGEIRRNWDPGAFPLGFQPAPGFGNGDAWVAKLKPDGSTFAWFSYLGGSGAEAGFGIALDADNNISVTGVTDSRDFPIADAPQLRFGGGRQDAFVAKVSADGQRLVYSTYLGGSHEEWGHRVVPDFQGNLIAVGLTASLNLPVRNAVQPTNASVGTVEKPMDAYIIKLAPAVEAAPLKIARSGNNVLLSWPASAIGFTLEFAGGLAAPIAWQPATTPTLVISGQTTVIEKISPEVRFYRLKRP